LRHEQDDARYDRRYPGRSPGGGALRRSLTRDAPSREPEDRDRRARPVLAVQVEEERGDRLDVARIADPLRVDRPEPGQQAHQGSDLRARGRVVAADDDVALESPGEIPEVLGGEVLERTDDPRGRQTPLDQLAR